MRVHRLGLAAMKGSRHEELERLTLTTTGPVGDRVFCVVDLARQRVLRTVEHPELIRVRTLWKDPVLELRLPGRVVADRPEPTGEVVELDYWGRRPRLALQRSSHAEALSDFLGRPVELARVTTSGDVVYGAPLTIVTCSDLAELGERVGVPDLVEESPRFRATVTLDDRDRPVPSGAAGTRLRLGGAVVELLDAIPRCAVIDKNIITGTKDRDLLAALAGYRQVAGEIWFGHYARVVSPGAVARGAEVALGSSPRRTDHRMDRHEAETTRR